MVFILVHGAFVGAWSWERVVPHLRASGHTVFTPTLAGLGERAHELCSEIALETHIADVTKLIDEGSMEEIMLVGHSYAGLVITGVAERVPNRIAELIYLDAVLPNDGDSFFGIVGAELEHHIRELACSTGDGWRMPPIWTAEALGLTDAEDCRSFNKRRTPQSLKTYEQALLLSTHASERIPRNYIFCAAEPTSHFFLPFFHRAKAQGWRCAELPTSHLPMFTIPQELANVLSDLATKSPALS